MQSKNKKILKKELLSNKYNAFFFLVVFFICIVTISASLLLFLLQNNIMKKSLDKIKDELKQDPQPLDDEDFLSIEDIKKLIIDLISGDENIEDLRDRVQKLLKKPANNNSDDKTQEIDEAETIDIDLFPPDTQFKPMSQAKFSQLHDFSSINGMNDEIKSLQNFLNYLKYPLDYSGWGLVQPPQGVLFYGVPGTGKTFFTRALAKEAGKQVGFYELAGSDFSCAFMGEAPQKVKDLFRDVRRHNKKGSVKASIIFIDECEEVFRDLGNLGENVSKDLVNTVNQFKTEITSIDNDPKKPILIIGATNHFNKIDEAIKSRLEYQIEIKVGDKAARTEYLKSLINKKRKNPYDKTAEEYLLTTLNALIDKFPEPERANRRLVQMIDEAVRSGINRYIEQKATHKKEIEEFEKTQNNQPIKIPTLTTQRINDLKKQLRKDHTKKEQLDNFTNQIKEITTKMKKSEEKLAQETVKRDQLETKIGQLSDNIEDLQNQPPLNQNDESDKLKKIQDAQSQKQEKESKIISPQPTIKTLTDEINNFKKQISDLDSQIRELQKDLKHEIIVNDLRKAFYSTYAMKILDAEKRYYEFQKLVNEYTTRTGQALYSATEINYFKKTLNPQIDELMQEARCDKLVAQLVSVSKRKFIEKNRTQLNQSDMEESFKEVYEGIKELQTYQDIPITLNNNY